MGLAPRKHQAGGAGQAGRLSVPGNEGANAGLKVASLVAGMVAGLARSMTWRYNRCMGRLSAAIYAPSTLAVVSSFVYVPGACPQGWTHGGVPVPAHADRPDPPGHDALAAAGSCADGAGFAFVDVDDTVIEVHGHHKTRIQLLATKVRGLNALLATATTPGAAPVIVAQRLRPRGLFLTPGREASGR